jgi:glycerophosphoryl diester phosphodiesterase
MTLLPDNIETGTVTGAFIDMAGLPAEGEVVFTPVPCRLANAAAVPPVTILGTPTVVDLDALGAFTVDLIATDDTDLEPTGWVYEVYIDLAVPQRSWRFYLAVPAGSTIDLATARPVLGSTSPAMVVGPPTP